jgi:UDP-N-acetylglucosamine--N-acetylmuramyl-(pentapeptide) pyrophosphoryl-undecaprenol N-acetylglucosamine transferase
MKVPAGPICLAAGGTGGHFFPALALAQALKDRGHEVIFVTDPRGAEKVQKNLQMMPHVLPLTSDRIGLVGKLKLLWSLGKSVWKCICILKAKKPKIVIGFGGYPSAPVVIGAILKNIPIILQEQNAYLGKVNRWLVKFATKMAVAFPEVQKIPKKSLNKVVKTGNPVRPEIQKLYADLYQIPKSEERFQIFVMGGSQGARIFGEVIPPALERLPLEIKERIHVTQQVRPEQMHEIQDFYKKNAIQTTIQPFFENVAECLQKAHLLITRAGASTLAEVMIAGRPVILVPYPYAADDHQMWNAKALAQENAAWLIPQSEFKIETLTSEIQHLIEEPRLLIEKAQNLRTLSIPDAAQLLANLVEETLTHLDCRQRRAL